MSTKFKIQKEIEDKSTSSSKNQLDQFLKKHKSDHLNYEETVTWKVSTGSLNFDAELGGGFGAGGIKVCGASFSGKTNLTLTCISNGMSTVPNSKAIWVKAEGRLDDEVKNRVNAKFVYSAEEWEVGTIFVLETNVYEFVIDLINDLVKNNPNNHRYFIVLDSVDALIRRDDDKKKAEEGERVGAGGMLMSLLFKKAGLILNKKGHCLFALSQIRAKVEVNQYAPKDQNKSVGGGGSNALTHGVNQVWNLKGRTKSENIEESGKVVGHYCSLILSKGVKERTDIPVKYPIRHGQVGGKSVWIEYEVADALIMWGYVEKKGAWIVFDSDFIKELNSSGFEVEEDFKLNGIQKLKDWLEQNPKITAHLHLELQKLR